MARRRMIDPNFWASEDVSRLSFFERLLLIGMFSTADDYGRGRGQAVCLRSTVFPYDDIKLSDIEKAISNIELHIDVDFYQNSGDTYYQFTKWQKWQRVDKPQPSKIPDITASQPFQNDSENDSENDSGLKEAKLREDKLREGGCKQPNQNKKTNPDEAIDYLNLKAGKTFHHTDANRTHVNARIRDEFTLDDMKRVVDSKVTEWINNPDMKKYIRPETIFGTKFDSYLQSAPMPIVTIESEIDPRQIQDVGTMTFDIEKCWKESTGGRLEDFGKPEREDW